jgi:GntR family transcriptional regulator, transcriptional repressor for pyruvate dehydrogenase complex
MTDVPIVSIYRPVSTHRLHESVVRQIVEQIISGTLAPGAFLPSEPVLAQQFGVSRTVIREAMRILSGKGLVEVKHGSGMQVQPAEQWNQLDPLLLFEQLRLGHDETLLNDLLEARRIVEVEVAALAAVRRTPEDLRTLHEQVDGMRAILDDPRAYTRLDIAFHDTILQAARNRFLTQTLRPASQALSVGRLISSQQPGGPVASEQGHEEILAAIESANAEQARTAMHRHILQFEQDIRTVLASGFSEKMAELTQEFSL